MESSHKRQWTFFGIGLLVGFLLSLTIYFIDKYWFNDTVKFASTIDRIYGNLFQEQEVKIQLKEAEIRQEYEAKQRLLEKQTLKLRQQPQVVAEVVEIDSNEIDFADPNFRMDNSEKQDSIQEEKLLQQLDYPFRKLQENDTINLNYKTINVEIWSSPIKNRMLYQRYHNHVKLQGIDPSQIEFYEYKGNVLMYKDSKYYILHSKNSFTQLEAFNPEI